MKAAALKVAEPKGSVGSNATPTVESRPAVLRTARYLLSVTRSVLIAFGGLTGLLRAELAAALERRNTAADGTLAYRGEYLVAVGGKRRAR